MLNFFFKFFSRKPSPKTYLEFISLLEKKIPAKDNYAVLTKSSLEYGLLTNKFILVEKPDNKFVISFFLMSDPQFVAIVYQTALEYFGSTKTEIQASFIYKISGDICLTTDPNFLKTYETILTGGKIYDILPPVPTQPSKKSELN